MDFDVIVVGGGPAGLTAAWKSAQLGLSTLVIEKKKHLCENKRSNTCILHICPGLYGENVSMRRRPGETSIVFQEHGFSLRYTGDHFDYYDSYLSSPSGHKIHMRGENRPLGTIFDMDAILSDLLRETSDRGVSFLTSALVIGGENKDHKASIRVKKKGKTFCIEASKVLVAEGPSSRVVDSLGLSKKHHCLPKTPFLQYTLEGVEYPLEPGIFSIWGTRIYMAPDATGKGRWVVISAPSLRARNCKDNLEYFLKESIYASWFKKASTVRKLGTTIEGFIPLVEPRQGHFLILGESTGCGETQVHGAMMCGWWAGNAVYDELSGKAGFRDYEKKWLESFPCCEEQCHTALMKVALVHTFFSNKELDYLFSLIGGKVIIGGPGNPYVGIERMMGLFAAQSTIKRDMAEKVEKFKNLQAEELRQLFQQWENRR
jgi:flavin-dependent dehydrogenase